MTTFNIQDHNDAPTLFADGEPTSAAIYLSVRNFRRDAEWQPDPYFEQFRDAGFHFYSILLPTRFDDAYDPRTAGFKLDAFAKMTDIRHYVQLDPLAKFLLRVDTEPRGDESVWLQQHPDECEVLESRAKGVYRTPSYGSQAWLDDAAKFIRALVTFIHDNALNEHILGYLVCGGDSSEWVKVGPMEDWAGDYSPAMQSAFRRWLRVKYNDDVVALRQAWADPNADFDQDLIPSPEQQGDADLFLFKDPRRQRRAIDHFECLSDIVAHDIDFLCGVAKEACHRQHLAGVFYGYLQEVVWNNGFFGQRLADADVAHTAAARSGHAGLKQVLASSNVDFLSSPYSYGFRGVGGEGGFMSPEASVRRAGKLWISEEDMRTHLWPERSFYGQTHSTRETVEVLKRQFANLITHAAGAWWCDWGMPEGGAFADPEVMAIFQRSLAIMQHHLYLPNRSSAAEVAIVIDAENWFYRSTLNNFDIPAWRNRAWGIARMGAPVDYILLTDLLEDRARDYKLYFFLNAFHLSAADRDKLKSVLRLDGKVALWQYAPGFSDCDLSANYCNDLTGIRLSMTERQWGANIFISNFDHAITRNLSTSTFWGTDMRLGPLFTVDDPSVTTLGTVVINQGRCEPGFVVKQADDWAGIYSAAPNLPPGVLREIARFANVHLFTESEDVLYADHNYVALHTVRAEIKTIRLPHRADVWEVYSNRQVGWDCTAFEDWIDAGSTHLYFYGPGVSTTIP